jgi:hypothetical protein
MGMYTEISFRATLKRDAPEEVVSALRAMIDLEKPEALPSHPLFECPRWDMLACSSSYYFPAHAPSGLEKDSIRGAWSVYLNADLKNYHDEIEKFFDWIDPYVDAAPGEFLGYELYEDVEPGTPPTPYFKK